jgi:hypothetical protein
MLGTLRRSVRRFLWVHRIGSRGVDLILLSVCWVIVGWSITLGDPDPQHKVPIEYLGEPVRIAIWYAGTVAGFIAAFRTANDRWGFGILIVAPALRAISYWTAWAQGILHLGGAVSLWPEAVLWTAVTVIVYRLARRPEMPHRPNGGDYGHHPGGAYGHPGLGEEERTDRGDE